MLAWDNHLAGRINGGHGPPNCLPYRTTALVSYDIAFRSCHITFVGWIMLDRDDHLPGWLSGGHGHANCMLCRISPGLFGCYDSPDGQDLHIHGT